MTASPKKRINTNSVIFMVIVAALLLIATMFYPVSTSLGQGINENVISRFAGVYNISSHQFVLAFYNQNTEQGEVPIAPLPLSLFHASAIPNQRVTQDDLPALLTDAMQTNATLLEQELGTNYNAPGFLAPFPHSPVAYTVSFLKDLAKQKMNLAAFGGPNIPPGSVPYGKLPGGVLHIDTKADGNVIAQCQPGQTPPVLKALNPSIVSFA
ncbi:hypothetical protein [Ferroacidibacillus organovorans]|uniref:Uncharacterized protein n=1 Tax=Ferroacidibacillus organovorans TaxID=1765683 RepID=A0A162SNS6_9BACL|nr:hypothetical protein [Ferroacidibacillus organovorans]KYP80011.1 hypothetical protein AYJ22_12840 [Ferroacidibacillus organovorans]OAG92997.1 hypothetical protein AYW79_12730 [Ferroacidibacillus organovorans]OPG15571.1 hypothetical protein B2M26_10890 [Ferroacidibacillus organovorans]